MVTQLASASLPAATLSGGRLGVALSIPVFGVRLTPPFLGGSLLVAAGMFLASRRPSPTPGR